MKDYNRIEIFLQIFPKILPFNILPNPGQGYTKSAKLKRLCLEVFDSSSRAPRELHSIFKRNKRAPVFGKTQFIAGKNTLFILTEVKQFLRKSLWASSEFCEKRKAALVISQVKRRQKMRKHKKEIPREANQAEIYSFFFQRKFSSLSVFLHNPFPTAYKMFHACFIMWLGVAESTSLSLSYLNRNNLLLVVLFLLQRSSSNRNNFS